MGLSALALQLCFRVCLLDLLHAHAAMASLAVERNPPRLVSNSVLLLAPGDLLSTDCPFSLRFNKAALHTYSVISQIFPTRISDFFTPFPAYPFLVILLKQLFAIFLVVNSDATVLIIYVLVFGVRHDTCEGIEGLSLHLFHRLSCFPRVRAITVAGRRSTSARPAVAFLQ